MRDASIIHPMPVAAARHRIAAQSLENLAVPCVTRTDGPTRPDPAVADLEADLPWLRCLLDRHGALLLRGLGLDHADAFRAAACLFCGAGLGDYVGGTSPRTAIGEGVYTSTEYPASREIALHNEMSYHHRWPRLIAFFCARPPATGGETPIADSRRVLAHLPVDLVDRFERKAICYRRTLPSAPGFAGSWERTFGTVERDEVEQLLTANAVDFHWGDGNALHTRQIRAAVQRHWRTNERVWFNQAHMWHRSSLDGMDNDADDDDLPMNATFGDGSPISTTDLALVREAYRHCEHRFPWQQGDVLLLDNMLFAHGRRPFTGNRLVLVAMSPE